MTSLVCQLGYIWNQLKSSSWAHLGGIFLLDHLMWEDLPEIQIILGEKIFHKYGSFGVMTQALNLGYTFWWKFVKKAMDVGGFCSLSAFLHLLPRLFILLLRHYFLLPQDSNIDCVPAGMSSF